jgi:prolyl 4-hydroxylase
MTSATIYEEANALLAAGNANAAVGLMTTAGGQGDGQALFQLALWHVYGDPLPRDFAAARALFGRAGAAGHSPGALTYAVFVAIGAGGPPDWTMAMKLLENAAMRDPAAARQIELLAAMQISPTGESQIKPQLEPLSVSPKLSVVSGLFTPAECAHIAAVASPHMTPSVVVDPSTHRQIPHPIRTSDGAVLGPIQQDVVTHALNLRIAAVTGTRVEQGEPLAVLRYGPGQQYRLHHDCLPGEVNQRGMSVIVYLNDDYAGGATQFPAITQTLRGSIGDAIIFSNILPNGGADERSRHAGLPVTRGQKWICTRWIRMQDFDPWGMRSC